MERVLNRLPKNGKACFGIRLAVGVKMIGFIMTVGSGVLLLGYVFIAVFFVFLITDGSRDKKYDGYDAFGLALALLAASIQVANFWLGCILLVGIFQKKIQLVKRWVYGSVILFPITSALAVLLVSSLFFFPSQDFHVGVLSLIGPTVIQVLVSIYTLYLISIVWNYHLEELQIAQKDIKDTKDNIRT